MGYEGLTTYRIEDLSYIKINGRTGRDKGSIALFWTGSGIELNCKASELWIETEADFENYEPWISILINGVRVSRQMLYKGRQWICIFRGMDQSTAKVVTISKDMQAMSGDEKHMFLIHSIKTDGEFLPLPEKKMKLEFIGDSITSGEGIIGAKQENDWISMWFDSVDHYAAITAKGLNADVRILSQSGWGVYCSWDNDPNAALPKYYTKVCGILHGDRNHVLGADAENDFTEWRPDYIIVNLGTNDTSAFHNPGWTDSSTGITYKQRLNEDGTFNEEDITKVQLAVYEFLKLLRNCNKEAVIIWAYGMIGKEIWTVISTALENYKTQFKDEKVFLVDLPQMTEESTGARYHPGVLAHEKAAEILIDSINKHLNH